MEEMAEFTDHRSIGSDAVIATFCLRAFFTLRGECVF
jgi:hypothetical protein